MTLTHYWQNGGRPDEILQHVRSVKPESRFDVRLGFDGRKISRELTSEFEGFARNRDFVFAIPELMTPVVSRFEMEQTFDCLVLSVDSDSRTFSARLTDRNGSPDEEGDFDFSEVPSDDWMLIVPGSLFSWTIGKQTRNGQVQRVSDIRFRRLPPLSRVALKRAEMVAAAWAEELSALNERSENWTER